MKTIKAVIFDLDGTIANTLPLCISAFRQSIEPLIDREVSDEEIIETFGPSEEGTIMALAPDHYEQGVSDYLRHYERSHFMCPAPFEGIADILGFLRENGVHTSMVTGKGRYSAEISLKQFCLSEAFEYVETGSPEGPSKPVGIQRILDKLENVTKDEVIYVGDVPSDILASRQVGVFSVAAAWAETAEPEKLLELNPDVVFYTLQEFSAWLKNRT